MIRQPIVLALVAALAAPLAPHAQAPGPGPPAVQTAIAQASPNQTPTGQAPVGELPVSLKRIREGLARKQSLDLAMPDVPVFSITVEGRLPRFADFVGEDALFRGPAPATSLTHREYLALVSPPQTQSFGAFDGSELVQVVATQMLFSLGTNMVLKAIDSIKEGRKASERERARREVQAVLDALARRAAQSPDVTKP